jgi:hypothetical protein
MIRVIDIDLTSEEATEMTAIRGHGDQCNPEATKTTEPPLEIFVSLVASK